MIFSNADFTIGLILMSIGFPMNWFMVPNTLSAISTNQIHQSLIKELIPEVRELMYLHYPEIETEFQPQIVKIIEQRLEDKCEILTIK